MEKGDPTIDEMMCFYKGSILQATVKDICTPMLPEINIAENHNITDSMKMKTELDGLFPEKIEASIEAMANHVPNLLLDMAKNAVDQLL